ncbi:hypothetical protein OY671_009461, partial [Metschnikowia pulcherrima]
FAEAGLGLIGCYGSHIHLHSINSIESFDSRSRSVKPIFQAIIHSFEAELGNVAQSSGLTDGQSRARAWPFAFGEEGHAFGVGGQGDETVLGAEENEDIASASAKVQDVGAAAWTGAIPDDEAGPCEPRHFAIFRAMEGSRAGRRVGSDSPDRPCADIVSGVRTAAKDRDVTNAAIGKEPSDGRVRTGCIADH